MIKTTKLFTDFFESEKAGGIVLVFVTLLSLVLANSSFGTNYIDIWDISINHHSLTHWINDGLMTIFFLLIGLELEREIYIGELSNIKNAALPAFAALGGMIVPASIFLFFNIYTNTQNGAGIPMATDIAFAIGILSLLGNKVPISLKIFLTALAVIDDLGAILIIALFYTKSISILHLCIALGIFILMLIMNRLKIYKLLPYLILGCFMWYFMLYSGVHATITGVLVAFAIPFENGSENSISYKLQHALHKPVAFVILPLFALANTAIILSTNTSMPFVNHNSLGIILGLVLGKPLGVFIFSKLGVLLKFAQIPEDICWKHIISVGFLAGIGFTMSIFVTLLAFSEEQWINNSKITILLASAIAGVLGYIFCTISLSKK